MESNESGITDADYATSVAAEEAEASELWDRLRSMGPATERETVRSAAWRVNRDHPLAEGLVFVGSLNRPGMVFIGDPARRDQ